MNVLFEEDKERKLLPKGFYFASAWKRFYGLLPYFTRNSKNIRTVRVKILFITLEQYTINVKNLAWLILGKTK